MPVGRVEQQLGHAALGARIAEIRRPLVVAQRLVEKLYADLLEKAGKDGDKAAFDKLKTAAEAGEISAAGRARRGDSAPARTTAPRGRRAGRRRSRRRLWLDSKESEKLYADLLEKAGKDGDKAAFDKLKTAAEGIAEIRRPLVVAQRLVDVGLDRALRVDRRHVGIVELPLRARAPCQPGRGPRRLRRVLAGALPARRLLRPRWAPG
jgi:hypothetical protein